MIRTFYPSDIVNFYRANILKTETYYKKYENLSLFKDGFIETLFKGKDFPRIPCVLDFKEWVQKYNIQPQKMLITCEGDFELHYIKPKSTFYFGYNESTNEGDFHKMDLPNKDFDFILFSQTLEHLYNPLLAIKKIYDHTEKGGWIFTSVPTINIPHMTPFHFSGLYPMGLGMLFESVGFTIKEIGQWGNIDYIDQLFKTHTWPDYEYLNAKGNGKIVNQEQNVVQCWCLAQKL